MTIANLAERDHLANEGESLRTCLSPLSDSSNEASDLSSSPNSVIVRENRTFGKNFTSSKSASEIKPILSPKPFCKKEPSEFAGVKKPIVTSKLYPLLKSWRPAKPAEQKQANDELQGSDRTIGKDTTLEDEGKNTYGLSTTKHSSYFMAEPNKNLTGISRSKSLHLTQELKDERKATYPLHKKQWQPHHAFEDVSKHLLSSENESSLQKDFTSFLNAGQYSSEGLVINKVAFSSDEKSKGFSKHFATEIEPSSRVTPIRRQRPVSLNQKLNKVQHKGAETCEGSSAKVLIQKSRPSSIDTSSKWESMSVGQLVSVSNESKENETSLNASETCVFDNENEILPKKEDGGHSSVKDSVQVEFYKPDSPTEDQGDNIQSSEQSFDMNNISPLMNTIHKFKVCNITDTNIKNNNETDTPFLYRTSDKTKIIKSNKQEGVLVDQRENGPLMLTTQSTESLKKEENLTPGGTIKNRISQLYSVSGTSPAFPEVQNEKEKGNISIQQRIQELTAENAVQKPGSTRRSFQSRPLSADLTKLFLKSGPATEIKSEKSLEKDGENFEAAQPDKGHKDVENQKSKEDQNIDQTSFGDCCAEGIQWMRPQTAATTDKEGRLMTRQNGSENWRSLSFRSKPSVSAPNLNEKMQIQMVSSERESSKTVRATLFDHKVEWHNTSDEHFKKDSVFMTNRTAVRKSDAFDLFKQEKEIMEKNEPEAKVYSREGDYRHIIVSEEKPHYEENTNNCQRVEPRYEIIQTVGERALSESILVMPEDKAVTLRSRKSSFHNKHTSRTDVNMLAADLPLRSSDNKTNMFEEYLSTSNAKDVAQSMVKKPIVTEKTDTNFEPKYKMVQSLSGAQKSEKAYLKEGYKTHRSARKEEIKASASENKKNSKVHETGQYTGNSNNPERFQACECLFSNNVEVQVETVENLDLKDKSENQSPGDSSRKSWISGSESSNTIDIFNNNHSRTELIAVDNGESRVFGLKQYHQIGSDNKDVNVNTNDAAEDKSKALKMGSKNRKLDGTVSNLKMSERWRRRSAPEDDISEFTTLSPTSRVADTLIAAEHEIVKWKESREFVDGNVLHQSKPNSHRDFRDSTVEQKARYFAVTGNVADFKKESDYAILKSEFSKIGFGHDTSFTETYSIKSNSNLPHSSANLALPYNNVSSETYSVRKSAREEKEEVLGLSKHGLSNINSNLDDDDRRKRNRNKSTGRMKENAIDVDCSLVARQEKMTINVVEKITKHQEPDTLSIQKHDEKVVQKNPDETRSYRSGVLDIDALMAEYASNNSKVNSTKGRLSHLCKNKKAFVREKSKSLRVRNENPSHKWKDEIESPGPGPNLKYLAEENRHTVVDYHSLEKNTLAGSSEEDCRAKVKERGTLVDPYDRMQQVCPFTGKYAGLGNECSNKEITVLSNVQSKTSRDVRCNSANLVPKPTNPVDVDIKTHFSEDFRASPNIRLREALSMRHKEVEKSQEHKHKPFEQAKANNDDSLMAIKADLLKFKDNLTEYSSNLKLSATEKCLNRPTKQRDEGTANLRKREQATRLLDVKHYSTPNMGSLANPVNVDSQAASDEDCSASRVTTDLHVQRDSSKQSMFVENSDGLKTKPVDRASLVKANNGDTLMALKADLIKFKSTLNEYSADLKPSSLGYERQAMKSESVEKKLKERRNEQRKDRYSLQLEYAESSMEKRLSFPHTRDSSYLLQDQLKQCFSRPASKDTETLVPEADSQYGTWSAGHQSQDSIVPQSPSADNAISTRKQTPNSRVSSSSSQLELDHHDAKKDQRTGSLDRSSVDLDSIDGTVLPPSVRSCPEEDEIDFSFMDQPSVLDSSALKNRVQLSRKSHRRAPTLQTQRRSKARLSESQFAVIEETDSNWMFKDTTDEKSKKEEESEEEEEKTPKSVVQRLPVFPGMDPSILKAQLRKRQESDSPSEISGAGHVYKSPKSSLQQGAIGGRPLPSSAEKDDRPIEMSPQWLQELKSRKRLSQYENSS
ncbi:hypothetical protein NDU88_005928 [Pleurodeles waltl]|uniref:Tankyrase 1-binding protein C-terminal domain-containing protein n=2 Tax=Pleurodeles waltl TaxID=8319 RepID=A0AAV7LVF8_PLEWA|nr:hypothetical protein NDU88_005928 [Pleurodeles waltl]